MVTTLFEAQATVRPLLADLVASVDFEEAVRRRAVQDAITDSLVWQLRRRAEVFEWAAPRPTDFTGNATEEELFTAVNRCHARAQALRSKAALIEWGWLS